MTDEIKYSFLCTIKGNATRAGEPKGELTGMHRKPLIFFFYCCSFVFTYNIIKMKPLNYIVYHTLILNVNTNIILN